VNKQSVPKKPEEQVYTNQVIRDLIAHAKRYNAGSLKMTSHNARTFAEGWCVELTVREHSECEDEE